jgi:hypothetical protein
MVETASVPSALPVAGLGEIEAAIFRQTVASVPYEHFSAEDLGLLCAYSRAMALERRASDELAACATIGDQASPWLDVYGTAVRAVSTYAVRLRLGPKARRPNTRGVSTSRLESRPIMS